MTTAILIVVSILVVSVAVNTLSEYKRDLMMLQQNSYRADRYMRWLRTSGDTTSLWRMAGMCVLFIGLAYGSRLDGMLPVAVFAICSAVSLMRRRYKKPLVWTRRAIRIYSVIVAISLASAVVAGGFAVERSMTDALFFFAMVLAALYCASHMMILLGVWILSPVERRINRKYYNEAASILAAMPNLKVVGVTGSYGKTSTKHYLYRILSEKYDVLMTPGSYNTTLGVIRTVREMMKPYCEVFICEMGAKQPGDIKEICDLVHPQIGIVTAVGPQHLESFKSIENVQRTKFELVDALPDDGLAVVNDDFPYVASRGVDNVECVRYGVRNTENVRYRAGSIEYDASGTTFTMIGDGMELKLHTHLVGECNVSNLIAAVAVALHLGVPAEKIRYAVEKIEQVEHRLNMKRTAGGVTIIDDAFNSNPTGSAMALDVLASMKSGSRIVITPGMIELGECQYELNRDFGRKIAVSADLAIVVGEYNRESIVEGINSVEDANVRLQTVDTFAEAQQLLMTVVKSGDVVLYENDLPDTFK